MLQEIIESIQKVNGARRQIDQCFCGLPHSHLMLLNILINQTNPNSGIVQNISYSELIEALSISAGAGRRNTASLSKQTIRSYLRTIENSYPEHFQVISEGQNLKIKFPILPGIYASYFETENTDVYTDRSTHLHTVKTIENTEQNDAFLVDENIEEYPDPYTDAYTAECSVKNNNIFNIINKQQTTETTKLSIRDDFYPCAKTIELAQSRGLFSVVDETQIRKFISYNQAKGTKWADYNPVYLNWLEQDLKRVQVVKQKESRRERNECNFNKTSKSKPTLADVIRANQNAVSPDGVRMYRDEFEGEYLEGSYGMALDQDDQDLRAAVY